MSIPKAVYQEKYLERQITERAATNTELTNRVLEIFENNETPHWVGLKSVYHALDAGNYNPQTAPYDFDQFSKLRYQYGR
ncbi:MAG: hypothetical protein JST90_14805 [Bacteroidetes bacterium]|nr:hypothetical protein [Bacteroidota bacterium]